MKCCVTEVNNKIREMPKPNYLPGWERKLWMNRNVNLPLDSSMQIHHIDRFIRGKRRSDLRPSVDIREADPRAQRSFTAGSRKRPQAGTAGN